MAEDLTRLEAVFTEALAHSTSGQRSAYLDRACADDRELRRRVEALLAAHEAPYPFLNLPPQRIEESPGAVIGRYKLLEQIGEGGFGVVFMAEQEHPVRRRVALKIIKLGMDSKPVVARFEAERQALAMMDHPGIAKVFDAGATESGRPYFVMELVKGEPITQFCDRNNLSIQQRLDLFAQVCLAVQHAHQKGLIHRDLKPSNVLVSRQDNRSVAKVIDFGVAKATQARLTEKTMFTGFHQLVGTPEYMSPEQADGTLDIDTRSDVYSLGVLLYDLLTGSPPFDSQQLRSKAFAEMQRIIREVDPPPPSTRVSGNQSLASVAAQRSIEPRELRAMLRGELDWIVMKCLEKDRARRYESASALAGDVMHYLAHEPVSAGAPSNFYRVRKFVRRHRVETIASVLILLTLIAGILGTTIGLIGQSRQRREAQKQAKLAEEQSAIAQAINRFQSDMLGSADPEKLLGEKVTVVQVISAAVKELDAGKLKDQPLVEAGVRDTIGNTLESLGRYDAAEPNLRKALELRRKKLSANDRDLATSLLNLAVLLQQENKPGEAEPMYREAIDIYHQNFPAAREQYATALNDFAQAELAQDKFAEGEKLLLESLAIYRTATPPDDSSVATILSNLALVANLQNHFSQAEAYAREAIALLRESVPAGSPLLGTALNSLSIVLKSQGKLEESRALQRETLEIFRRAYPPDHPNVATGASNVAADLQAEKKFAEAEPLFREALAIRRKSMQSNPELIASSEKNLADDLIDEKKFSEAETLLLDARKSLPEAEARDALVALYTAWDKAEPRKGFDAKAAEWRAKATTKPK